MLLHWKYKYCIFKYTSVFLLQVHAIKYAVTLLYIITAEKKEICSSWPSNYILSKHGCGWEMLILSFYLPHTSYTYLLS